MAMRPAEMLTGSEPARSDLVEAQPIGGGHAHT